MKVSNRVIWSDYNTDVGFGLKSLCGLRRAEIQGWILILYSPASYRANFRWAYIILPAVSAATICAVCACGLRRTGICATYEGFSLSVQFADLSRPFFEMAVSFSTVRVNTE